MLRSFSIITLMWIVYLLSIKLIFDTLSAFSRFIDFATSKENIDKNVLCNNLMSFRLGKENEETRAEDLGTV